MRRKLLSILSLAIFCLTSSLHASDGDRPKLIVANPMNLNYRFMIDGNSRREAADPVIEYFKGRYYLFASKSGGYWFARLVSLELYSLQDDYEYRELCSYCNGI